MLIDEAFITVQAGKGGEGKVSFYPSKKGPNGGNGGNGGNIFATLNTNMDSVSRYVEKTLFEAEDGHGGESFTKTGADGKDLILSFPPGTELIDPVNKEKFSLVAGIKTLIAKGGVGGRGNEQFKTSTNQTPRFAEPGTKGQRRGFKVIMRLIAHVGLIGLPNAGKSSLLNELTAAKARIAPYPFTTLEPNLGVLEELGSLGELGGFGRGRRIIADIPGLIEGASSGKGLGTKFLKHVEKVELLVHCISCENDVETMKKNYDTIRAELHSFNPLLSEKEEIILITKTDLIPPNEVQKRIDFFQTLRKGVLSVSIHDRDALLRLKQVITG